MKSSHRVRSLELNTIRENILSWFESTFPERQTGGQSKTHGECCLKGAMRHEEVWLFNTDAAVMEMLLLSVSLMCWNTHWDTAWQCSAESLSHFPRNLCPPAVARERCSVLSWWSVLLHRSLSRTTMATTNSNLRPGELGIKHQTYQAEITKTHVMYYPLDFFSVK